MNIFFDKIASLLNLSSPANFVAVLIGCVLTTCMMSDIITVIGFNARLPEIIENYSFEIRLQTFITTFLLSSFFFTIMLLLLRHIDQLRKALSEEIRHDNLTGILARAAFLDTVRSNNSAGTSNAFLLIDADFFKRINDTHGHAVGDKALIAITNALQKGTRASDFIGRIGGEEFGVQLRNIEKREALEIAERLRKNVKEANQDFGYPDIDLSVSIGAVLYEDQIKLPDLMKMADELLYKAKENGRNRVEHIMLYGSTLNAA
jgi:diguanylate cyclase (GGDEF)-like protein